MQKKLTIEQVIELYTATRVNTRYLRATINHFTAMFNCLTGKKDEKLRLKYQQKIDVAKRQLQAEEYSHKIYQQTLNRHNVTIH